MRRSHRSLFPSLLLRLVSLAQDPEQRRRALSLCLVLTSCASVPKPTADTLTHAQARWHEATLESLNQARKLYLHKCGSCHRVYPASKHSTADWARELDKMAVKAKLKPGEKETLLRFLAAMGP